MVSSGVVSKAPKAKIQGLVENDLFAWEHSHLRTQGLRQHHEIAFPVVNIPEGRKINDSSFVFEPAMPVSGLGMQSVRLVTTLIQHIDVVVGVYLAPRMFRRVVRIVEDSALHLDSDPKEV